MSTKFDVKLFFDALFKQQAFAYDQIQAIKLSLRVASGEELPKHGDVFKSTRGVRMVVGLPCNKYSLICLKAFDSQYSGTEGRFIGNKNQDITSLMEYMTQRKYVKLGHISKLNVAKVKK